MPSETYELFREAILGEKQVTCIYQGYYRELCPVVLGHKKGQEKVLAYQFGGESSRTLPRGGEWRCLYLAQVEDAVLREGPWREGASHRRPQACIDGVDLDINIHVRKLRS